MTRIAHEPIHPGEILLDDFLTPMGISQSRLARAMHVPRRRINEIVHGTRRITPATGLRLSKAFGVSESFWIELQADYDIAVVKTQRSDALAEVEHLGA
ncbi:HigA family addiction module antitoxin [Brachybacterium sp. NPDC056505]|uniref:HigA family addiction module antitoxin n=1 Tax=Brachybacterium sp. NPDC056505 TaxID=3345843 RepID=UPI00366B1F49